MLGGLQEDAVYNCQMVFPSSGWEVENLAAASAALFSLPATWQMANLNPIVFSFRLQKPWVLHILDSLVIGEDAKKWLMVCGQQEGLAS